MKKNGLMRNNPRSKFVHSTLKGLLRPLIIFCGLILLWQFIVIFTKVPAFLLPPPSLVLGTLIEKYELLIYHSWFTLSVILAGLVLAIIIAISVSLALKAFPILSYWGMPIMIGSQALPVFTLAPLLSLWLGFGFSSKLVMACLIIYFPIASSFYDGLNQTREEHIKAALSLGANRWQILFNVRLPSALPALASGIRIGMTVAPIGAIIGEWVGSSRGLGYLMLHANGRMETDLMFAALFILILIGLSLHKIGNFIEKHPAALLRIHRQNAQYH